jgi:hypothetical protein
MAATNKIYCQLCSKSHNKVGECTHPAAVLGQIRYKDWEFELGPGAQWFRVAFAAGDPHVEWKGRKWLLSPHMLKSEVIQTAFLAVLTAEEHETREAFLYKGVAVMSPHYDLDRLVALHGQGITRGR